MKERKIPEVERGQSVQFRVDEHIDVSGYQLADLMREWIAARMRPEIEAKRRENRRGGFMASLEPKDVTKKGIKIAVCDSSPPYYTDSTHLIPIPERLMRVLEAAEIMEQEMHNDPTSDGY